jgi:hypothetical protein
MSIHVLNWVLRHSEARLGDRLVLLSLADHAKEDGTSAWPSQETIAVCARLTDRQVRRCLANLERDGRIRKAGTSRSGTTVWAVNMSADNMSRRTNATETRSDLSTEPSVEPSVERERVARARVRVGGQPVNDDAWDLTLRVLEAFNAHSGRKYRALKSSGQPSEAAKYVYKRIREYPDLGYEKHVDIIRRVVASKWWGDAPASFNVVYGPRVFEENITRPGIPRGAATSGAEAERLARQARRAERIAELEAEGAA